MQMDAANNGSMEIFFFTPSSTGNQFQYNASQQSFRMIESGTECERFTASKSFIVGNTFFGGSNTTASSTIQVRGASSTIRIGQGGASVGCLETYDSVNTTTLEYWYTANSIISATTTKPSWCE
jgi:hypothetical protein